MSKAQPPKGAADPSEEAGTIARDRTTGDGSAPSGVSSRPTGVRTEPDPERLPRMLAGRYRLEQLIAKGGMGQVYLGTQLPLGRRVAVKVLRVAVDEELGRRFFLEASICAKLQHRHIVTVHDYGETDDGELFMVMEYLDGEPLSLVMTRGRIPTLRVIDVMQQVARALRAAHREGTVHRDLKPGNVMLLHDAEHGEDVVKVVDFGLVKVFQAKAEQQPESELTRAGSLLGSPRYMAPEQILGETVDARTDIYAFGVLLFTLLTGRAPFVGGPRGTVEVLNQHLRDPVPRFRDVTTDDTIGPASAALQAIVDRCMQKSAMDRYPSMDEVIVDLRNALVIAGGAGLLDSASLSRELAISGAFRVPVIKPSSKPPPADSAWPAPTTPPTTPVEAAPSAIEPPRFHSAPPAASGSRAKLAVLVGAIAIGTVAGVIAIARSRGDDTPEPASTPSTASSAPARPTDVSVRLGSSPAGAQVFLDGQSLGTTPLVHHLPRLPAGETKRFVFRLAGHVESAVTAELDRDSVDVLASLPPEPVGIAAPPSVPPPTPATSPTASAEEPAHARPGAGRLRRRGASASAAPTSPSAPSTPAAAPTEPARTAEPPRRPSLPAGVRVVDDQPGGRVPIVD